MANQRGQAIVLIALMLTIIIGMAAIAIDGSRAYALRRDLQVAVDAAALATCAFTAGPRAIPRGRHPPRRRSPSPAITRTQTRLS